jgi:hypothetical protein
MLKSYKNILKATFVDSIDVSPFKRGINALESSTFRIDYLFIYILVYTICKMAVAWKHKHVKRLLRKLCHAIMRMLHSIGYHRFLRHWKTWPNREYEWCYYFKTRAEIIMTKVNSESEMYLLLRYLSIWIFKYLNVVMCVWLTIDEVWIGD